MKILGQDADDLAGFPVGDDGAADDRGVGAEFAAPVSVGDDGSERGAGSVVLAAESAAEDGIDAEQGQGPIGHVQRLHLFRFGDAGDAEGFAVIGTDVDEAFVLLAKDKVSGGGDVEGQDVESWRFLPDADEFLGVRIRQRFEEHALENAENYGVASYACGKGDQRDGGEHRGAAQPAEDLLELTAKFPHE